MPAAQLKQHCAVFMSGTSAQSQQRFECRHPRRYIDYDTLYTLIRALILSRLDYCNSLFVCSSQSTLHRLQRVQDAAARLLCGASARTHAPPLEAASLAASVEQNSVQTVYFNV